MAEPASPGIPLRSIGSRWANVRATARLDRWSLAVAAALGVGVALRVFHLASGRSFWIDEARLALTIASRSYAALLTPLDYDQVAPPLFLWSEKLATDLFGLSELSLRLLPFLAGVLALFLFGRIAGQFLTKRGALLAVALLAVAPFPVYYSAELKQYSIDLLTTVLLTWFMVRWFDQLDELTRYVQVLLAGILAIWVSAPSAFVLAGMGLAIVIQHWSASLSARLRVAAMGAAWALSFLAAHATLYGQSTHNPYLQWFWTSGFLDVGDPSHSWLAIRDVMCGLLAGWSTEWPMTDLQIASADVTAVLLLGLGVLGCVRLARTGGSWLPAMMAGALGSAVGASLLHLYPLGIRTMLFTAPLLTLAVGAGLERLWEAPARSWSHRLATAGAVYLVGTNLVFCAGRVVTGATWGRLPEVLEAYRSQSQPGDLVYVFSGAIPAWLFYTTDWSRPDTARLRFYATAARSDGPAFENRVSRRGPVINEGAELTYRSGRHFELAGIPTGIEARYLVGPAVREADSGWYGHEATRIYHSDARVVWLVFTHYYGFEPYLVYALEALGARRTFDMQSSGALLFRYEFPMKSPE